MSNKKNSSIIRRYENNPILSKDNISYKSDLVFNAGVTKYKDQYYMIFRNDYLYEGKTFEEGHFHGTNLGLATSNDGINWKASDHPIKFDIEDNDEVIRVYDPRITVIEEQIYICFAIDTKHGLLGGIATTKDFAAFTTISTTTPDNRNMVLFPSMINGLYARLERPMPVYSRGKDRFDIWISYSKDLEFWGRSSLLLSVEDVPSSNDKIGPGSPPVLTEYGWLATFHSVDIDYNRGKNGWEDKWQKRYSTGIMLLEKDNPNNIIAKVDDILIPETLYECNGFRNDVIFPGGMILENDDQIKIYYGAADTVECLAFTTVKEIMDLIR